MVGGGFTMSRRELKMSGSGRERVESEWEWV